MSSTNSSVNTTISLCFAQDVEPKFDTTPTSSRAKFDATPIIIQYQIYYMQSLM